MSNTQLKKELNRAGWIRKGGIWRKKGAGAEYELTLAEAKEKAGIK